MGTTPRDFVQKRSYLIDYPKKKNIMMQIESVEHPHVPPIKGFVRARTLISGYLIRTDENNPKNVKLEMVSQTDPVAVN
jgi:hypothetical protein